MLRREELSRKEEVSPEEELSRGMRSVLRRILEKFIGISRGGERARVSFPLGPQGGGHERANALVRSATKSG